MKTFNEWQQLQEAVEVMGQEAEAVFHKIVDMLKPFSPGTKLTLIHEVPVQKWENGKESGHAGYHVFTHDVEINDQGIWTLKPKNRFNGSTEDKAYGFDERKSYFGMQNIMNSIESMVFSAFYHAGKIWVVKDGHKEMLKDATLDDPRGPQTVKNPNPNGSKPHFGTTDDQDILQGRKPDAIA